MLWGHRRTVATTLATSAKTDYENATMCTVVILRRPGHAWPLIIAANRDEMADRPSAPPARHWPDRGHVVAGLDQLAGGTWLGINDDGIVAAALNRVGGLGPHPDFRSRGELPLEALDHAEAGVAAEALSDLDPAAYRPFNLVVADARDAFWLRGTGNQVTANPIPPGVSMLTAHDLNDAGSPRIRVNRPLFEAAPEPDPETDAWDDWAALLMSRYPEDGAGPGEAMAIAADGGYGTVSSSLIALPAPGRPGISPCWKYADGGPGEAAFCPVEG